MSIRKILALALALVVAVSALPAMAAVLLDDNFDDSVASGEYTLGQVWADAETHGGWYVNFLGFGYGKVINSTNARVELAPCDNGQVFLATGSSPTVSTTFKTVTIRQSGTVVDVWVGGVQIDLNGSLGGKSLSDSRLFTQGMVGLYTEDAKVQFDDVLVSSF